MPRRNETCLVNRIEREARPLFERSGVPFQGLPSDTKSRMISKSRRELFMILSRLREEVLN